MDHLGFAEGLRLIRIGFKVVFKGEGDGLATVQVRLCGLSNKSRPQRGAQMQIFFSRAPHGSENRATTFSLFSDKLGVGMQGFCIFQFFHQFGADQFYRGERRAQLMGRGCHNAAQVGEFLLPRQGHLRGQKGL